MVLKDEFKAMQERYSQNPLQNVEIYAPDWLNSRDPMWRIYTDRSLLLKQGKVTPAYIVQANEYLFKFFPRGDYPAHLIYSADPYVAEHPEILKKLADEIYSYKNKPLDTVPKEWREVAQCITNERDRTSFTIAMTHDGYHIELQLLPIMVFRKLLPWGRLCGSYLPVLTSPESKAVLILPKKYWTGKFRRAWSTRSI